jgi:PKHD-type hydroxylase|tara:strand:+ start:206 stop:841 length:636 start_codon:yes stop_codon:yes gene_type:complete
MNISNYYWYFKSALTPKFCDDVIKYALSKKETMAKTGGFEKDEKESNLKNMKHKRNSDLVWMDDTWIYKELHPFVHEANRNAGWNFQWDRSESCQFTKYKLGQYYDWHSDSWPKPYERKDPKHPEHGKIRKLSMTCQLTDGSEYTGGELEFDFRNYDPHMRDESKHLIRCQEILPKGSIIVFPSFVWHRVKPVTSGTRYSLVVWNLGWPFN